MKRYVSTANRPLSSFIAASLVAAFLTLWGCSSSKPESGMGTVKPEMSLHVATLDLKNFKKRMERKEIDQLVRMLKKEQIDVFAAQNISRYPDVATRIDFVDELSTLTGWRNAFGEMANMSGHQTGNAVFSSYPILSHNNISFDGIKSATFEAALQAVVDAGVGSITVISSQFPPKGTAAETGQCLKAITAGIADNKNFPVVIAGSIPSTFQIPSSINLERSTADHGAQAPELWNIHTPMLKAASSRTVRTDLGTLTIVNFDVFRQQ